jgi:hypothetical protein
MVIPHLYSVATGLPERVDLRTVPVLGTAFFGEEPFRLSRVTLSNDGLRGTELNAHDLDQVRTRFRLAAARDCLHETNRLRRPHTRRLAGFGWLLVPCLGAALSPDTLDGYAAVRKMDLTFNAEGRSSPCRSAKATVCGKASAPPVWTRSHTAAPSASPRRQAQFDLLLVGTCTRDIDQPCANLDSARASHANAEAAFALKEASPRRRSCCRPSALLSISIEYSEGAAMATEQLLLRLPDDLVRRFKRSVPSRRRSAFVQQLLEQALPPVQGDDDPLYQAALAVERDARLTDEMAEWEAATVNDGLAAAPSRKRRR